MESEFAELWNRAPSGTVVRMLADRATSEVLRDAVFEASGEMHIFQVVKRLGYGLDENALAAARRMRLCPDVGTLNRTTAPRSFISCRTF
jgi:hypothetical protein